MNTLEIYEAKFATISGNNVIYIMNEDHNSDMVEFYKVKIRIIENKLLKFDGFQLQSDYLTTDMRFWLDDPEDIKLLNSYLNPNKYFKKCFKTIFFFFETSKAYWRPKTDQRVPQKERIPFSAVFSNFTLYNSDNIQPKIKAHLKDDL